MRQSFIIIISLIISHTTYSQIYGNGNLTTITIDISGIEEIDIELNANITLDYSAKESMTITADENVIKYMGRKFKNGKLTLDQIKWIEPSKNPTIVIGTPNLKKIYQGTHSSTYITNINSNRLSIKGNVGKVFASGSCKEIRVNVSGTSVDLSNTKIEEADISIDGNGTVTLGKVNMLDTDLERNSNLVLLYEPNEYLGNSEKNINENINDRDFFPNSDLKFIQFKIKNNSWSRNHFYVVGPKKDGSTFSYGFPMMPGFSKSEKWSVGTKIYQEGKMGNRKLLVTITAEDKGTVVNLF